MKSRRDRVLGALKRGKDKGDGWVCARSLIHPQCGGNRASARLHELRKAGVRMESKTCDCAECRYYNKRAIDRSEQAPYMKAWRLLGEGEAPNPQRKPATARTLRTAITRCPRGAIHPDTHPKAYVPVPPCSTCGREILWPFSCTHGKARHEARR